MKRAMPLLILMLALLCAAGVVAEAAWITVHPEIRVGVWGASAATIILVMLLFLHFQVRRSEERFRGLTEHGTDITQAFRDDGTLVYGSPSHGPLLGYAEKELIGTSILDLFHPEDREKWRRVRKTIGESGAVATFIHRMRRKDGLYRIFESNVVNLLHNRALKAIVLNGRDITDRTEAEAELRRSEETLRAVFDGVNAAIFIHEEDGTVIDVNRRMLTLYGVSREDAKTLSIAEDFSGPESPIEELDAMWRAVMTGETRLFEWQARRPHDGGLFPVQVFLRQMPLKDRAVVLASVLDITEQKAAEAKMREAWNQAEAANRTKSEFLANMSHELRTPMNGILGYTQLMRQARDLSPKHREAVDVIHLSGEHLLSMINDVLDMSRIEADKMILESIEFNLPIFLKNIAAIHENMAIHKGIGFEYRAAPDLPDGVRGDEVRLRQVLFNLLGNAVKFTHRGRVTFSATRLPPLKRPAGGDRARLRFTMEDSGIGIPPDKLEEIFVPFQQAVSQREPYGGTGLGLAISRRLAHLMGGEISVESTPGEGSVFGFEIELEEVPLSGRTNPGREWRLFTGYEGERRTVLVADDREINRKLLAKILISADFKVIEAVDGGEAVKKAAKFRPDMILMDLMMPVMDGFEATRRIRQHPDIAHTVVIAVSASVLDDIREKSLAAGCDDYLLKPIRMEMLMEKIGWHLDLRWVVPEGETEGGTKDRPEAAPPPGDIVPPARDRLEALMEMARSGDVLGLAREAARLAEIPTHRGFGRTLKRMADNLEINKIKRFIAGFLEAPDDA